MAKFFLTPKGLIARFPWVQTPAWMVEAGVFYLMLGFARLLPFSVASGLFARALGWLGYRNAQKRRTVGRNLLHVLPEASDTKRDAVMRDIFRSTGRAAAELFLLERLWQNRTRHLEFSVHPEAEEIIARKEAIVFATAHVSAWQLCNLIGRERELTISVIYTPEPNPWLRPPAPCLPCWHSAAIRWCRYAPCACPTPAFGSRFWPPLPQPIPICRAKSVSLT